MKAIKVPEPYKMVIEEIPEPQIVSEYDVKIRITSGGICGSDIAIWNGTNSLATYPRIIGHEFGGIVTEIGSKVTTVKKGDKVAVDPVISCGECYPCRIGRHNVCASLEVMGVHRDGGFCEYVCVPEKNVYSYPEDFDEKKLSVAEPFSIGMQMNQRACTDERDKILIMGAGPIGISALQIAKSRGAQVLITDIVKSRLEKAKKMGADMTVLIKEHNLEEAIDTFTNDEGVTVVMDTVCMPSSLEEAVKIACPAGRVVVIGLKNQLSQISMADITKKELTIVGSRLNCNCFSEVIQKIAEKRINIDEYVTNFFSFEEIEKAFSIIVEHPQDVLKVILNWESE